MLCAVRVVQAPLPERLAPVVVADLLYIAINMSTSSKSPPRWGKSAFHTFEAIFGHQQQSILQPAKCCSYCRQQSTVDQDA